MSLVKMVVQVVVLSNGEVDFDDLASLHDLITTGDCSGSWEVTDIFQLTKEEMSVELENQGSDPDFLTPLSELEPYED